MAYKNSSDLKQASLRRITPKRLGDFDVTDLSLEQKRENLIAKIEATQDGHEKLKLGSEVRELNKQIERFRWAGRNLGDLMLCVIKSEVTKSQWKIWHEKAKQLADIRNKIPADKFNELMDSGELENYDKIMQIWKEMKDEV